MNRSVVIVLPRRSQAVEQRARALAVALHKHGHRVFVTDARRAALKALRGSACVITLSPSRAAHLAGYVVARRGVPWIADIDPESAERSRDGPRSIRRLRRLLVSADALICRDELARWEIFERLHASAALVGDDDPGAIGRQVGALISTPAPGRLRILMVGPVNSPHMEHLAIEIKSRGHVVRAGGAVWGHGLQPSRLPDAGIPVSTMTRPQPLWLRRQARRFSADVVHANWMPFAAVAALAGIRPLVAMAWGSDVYRARPIEALANRLALRRADCSLADSTALLSRLVELGAPRERVALLNWGVALETFKPAASEDERRTLRGSLGLGDGPVIISARGLKDLYNPETVLAAFARCRDELSGVQLVLKHNGEEAPPEFSDLIREERVRLVGRVTYKQMSDYFRAADVCVSIPSTDSSPRSVWEAMACGCACVLSDLPWIHELIRPGVHALVVPIDPGAVARAINRLVLDTELRSSIGAEARRLVERERDVVREMDRLEALYLRLASRPVPRPAGEASVESNTPASSPVSARRE